MPQNIILGPSTYSGEAAAKLLGDAIVPSDLLTKYMTIIPNIKGIYKYQMADTTNVIKNYSAAFAPQNTNEQIFEKSLTPFDFEVQKQYNLKSLRTDWLNYNIAKGTKNDPRNIDFETYIYKRTSDKLAIDVQRIIFQGKNAVASASTWSENFIGLIERMRSNTLGFDIPASQKLDIGSIAITASSIVVNPIIAGKSTVSSQVTFTVASSTGIERGTTISVRGIAGGLGAILNTKNGIVIAFTATTIVVRFNELDLTGAPAGTFASAFIKYVNQNNVIAVVRDMYAAIPSHMRYDPAFNLMVSPDIFTAYKQATVSQKIGSGFTFAGDVQMAYLDMGLEDMLYSLPPGTMLFARKDELLIGTDIFGEETQASIVDLSQTTNDHFVNVRMGSKIDVNYGMGTNVVLTTAL